MSTQRADDGEDVSVGLVAPAYVCVPLWIAQRRGLLERVGIRATVQICGTTDGTTQAVRSGAVQSGPPAVRARAFPAKTPISQALSGGFESR